jgi:hypothetical protein
VTRLGLIALLTLAASPAPAATITEIGGFDTTLQSVQLRASDFTRVGPCGGGLSVSGDGCSAIPVGALQQTYGRYAGEIDSQDASQLWNLSFAQPRSVFQFSVSDMMDMSWSQSFRMTAHDTSAVDAVWEETQRQQGGTIRYFQVVLDQAAQAVSMLFEHIGIQPGKPFSGDGFGVGVCRKSVE